MPHYGLSDWQLLNIQRGIWYTIESVFSANKVVLENMLAHSDIAKQMITANHDMDNPTEYYKMFYN